MEGDKKVESVLSVLESEPSSAQLIEMVFSRYPKLEYSGLIKNNHHALATCTLIFFYFILKHFDLL